MKIAPQPSKDQKLSTALADIASMDRAALSDLWHDLIGGPPPKNLSLPFLRRALAFEMQCRVLGGPKVGTIADLQRIAVGRSARASTGARLQPGTRLVREWQGRTWTVEVIDGGFLMGGERFDSLSGIAKKITGAHWSGPRFFGLTGKMPRDIASGTKDGNMFAPARGRRAA